MASPIRRSSTGVDRRASMRTSMRLSRQPDDDDEYALAAMGISDGFRPADMAAGPQSISSNVELPPVRRSTPPPRPSSVSKPKGLDSFALLHDGQMGPVSMRDAAVASSSQMPTRSSSVSANEPFVRSESPYQGPAGPSHPYQMYPQESRAARTASIATTATAAPIVERNYTGPSGPTHPYGMYPQNTVPEAEVHNPSPVAPIPVGFPGLNNNYQRRLGPEGEEIAGIIGPDGHTEELPPYTQYPEEAFARKTRPTVGASIVTPVAGAGGIGLATRNPEFASREDLNSPQSRQSTRSFASDGSTHQVNTAALGASEKPELKHWQKVARRRVCGIVPIWAFFLVGVIFIFFGIILGSVLAALKPKDKGRHGRPNSSGDSQDTYSTTTMTTTFDATPFTTVPSGLPTLPTGTFALPIQIPSTVESSCIDNSAQSAAWACNMPPSSLQMTIQSIPGTSSVMSNEITIDLGNNSMPVYPYGAQPPIISTAQVMSLVTDSQDVSKGPAWFFQVPYNKLVVLPENVLSASSSKRQVPSFNQIGDFRRKGVAQPGDRPWFCYWNGTLLETFIYVNLTSSQASQSSTTSSSSISSATSSRSSSSAATQTSTSSANSGDNDPTFLAPYPKVLKVEERRIPKGGQTISPYCIQQVINSAGYPSPALNTTGGEIRIYLNETEPTTVSPISDKRDLFVPLEPRDMHLSERQDSETCGCVWLAT